MNGEVLWRDTGLTPKIFILDARAIFPLALWLFHWSWWTAAIACLGIVALFFVQLRHVASCLSQGDTHGVHGQTPGDQIHRNPLAQTMPLVIQQPERSST